MLDGALQPASPKDFTAQDFYAISYDPHKRFMSPKRAAYALVSYTLDKGRIAEHFPLPAIQDQQYPIIDSLQRIFFNQTGNDQTIKAWSSDFRCMMTTKRYIDFDVYKGNEHSAHYRLYFFSPYTTYTKSQNLSFTETIDLTNDDEPVGPQKGGTIEVKNSNIALSRGQRYALPSAFYTMGMSARHAFCKLHKMVPLAPAIGNMMLRCIQTSYHDDNERGLRDYKYPEWCHALGAQFHHPQFDNPQRRSNLGAAPYWVNSKMMVVENSLGWLARAYPDAQIQLSSCFEVFQDHDVVKKCEMNASVKRGDVTVRIRQTIEPFQTAFPAYAEITDTAFTAFALNHLLNETPPTPIPIKVKQPAARYTPRYSAQIQTSNLVADTAALSSDPDPSRSLRIENKNSP